MVEFWFSTLGLINRPRFAPKHVVYLSRARCLPRRDRQDRDIVSTETEYMIHTHTHTQRSAGTGRPQVPNEERMVACWHAGAMYARMHRRADMQAVERTKGFLAVWMQPDDGRGGPRKG